MSTRKVLWAGLWAVAVYAALTACSLALVDAYGDAMLPLYRWELGWIAPAYSVQDLDVDRSSTERAFRIAALNNEYVYVDGKLLPPGSFTTAGQVAVMPGLQHVVLLLLVPLAWPGLTWKRRLAATVCAIPALCLVEFVDIPVDMVGGLDLTNATYNHAPNTFAMTWAEMLDTGGRLALGLVGGLLACGMASVCNVRRLRTWRR